MGGRQQLGAVVVPGDAHFCMLASLDEGTDGVEGTRATGVQVGPVVGVQDLHKVHALSLGMERMKGEVVLGQAPGTTLASHSMLQSLTVMSLPAQLHSSLHSTGAGQ